MAKIKIDQFNDYYNAELTGVFHEDVAILGGGDTEEEAIANMKANAETWLEYVIEEAKVEKYWNGEPVERLKAEMKTQTEIDKAYKEGYKKGAEEMRLEAKKPIEKFIKQRERQAVKEFSEKLIRLVFDYLDVENAEQAEKLSLIDSTLTYDVILHAIDKLIEEEN